MRLRSKQMSTQKQPSTAFARKLRKNQTEAERRLWHFLRNRQLAGFKFRRQHSVAAYTVDFICLDGQLVVELDGGQHSDQSKYDLARTKHLETLGLRVLRFWDDDALLRTEAVLEEILRELKKA